MPSSAVAAATRFCVTTPFVTWCALLCLSSPRSLPRLKNWASFSLRGPLIRTRPSVSPLPLAFRHMLLLVVVLPMSGSPGVCLVLLRLGADVLQEVEARNCAFQGTAAAVAERGASFVPLVLEACGEREGVGPRPFGQSWLGLPPSHALPAALPLISLETLASAAPFTRKMRAQS